MAVNNEKAHTIITAVRIRPLIPREKKTNAQLHWKEKEGSESWFIKQIDPTTKKIIPTNPAAQEYCYDRVFGMTSSTQDVFDDVVRPMVDDFFEGFNCTVFAYGQTSSGKTHTMSGDANEPGVIPLIVHRVFQRIDESVNRHFIFSVTYVEIYEDRVRDLLVDPSSSSSSSSNNIASNRVDDLAVREDEEGRTFIEGVESAFVTSEEEIYAKKQEGERRRHFAETVMNNRSSRSHTIFTLTLESQDRGSEESGAVRRSIMNLVDLAGSEKPGKTGSKGETFREGVNINQSLTDLTRVIEILSENAANPRKQQHVPYRNSKLTRILKDSLGGNSRTAVICAVTPASVEETKNTLRFGLNCKKIKNSAHVNEFVSDEVLLKRKTKEILKLKERLAEMEKERNAEAQTPDSERREEHERKMTEKDERLEEQRRALEKLQKLFIHSLDSASNAAPKPSAFKTRARRRETWAPGQGGKNLRRRSSFYPSFTLTRCGADPAAAPTLLEDSQISAPAPSDTPCATPSTAFVRSGPQSAFVTTRLRPPARRSNLSSSAIKSSLQLSGKNTLPQQPQETAAAPSSSAKRAKRVNFGDEIVTSRYSPLPDPPSVDDEDNRSRLRQLEDELLDKDLAIATLERELCTIKERMSRETMLRKTVSEDNLALKPPPRPPSADFSEMKVKCAEYADLCETLQGDNDRVEAEKRELVERATALERENDELHEMLADREDFDMERVKEELERVREENRELTSKWAEKSFCLHEKSAWEGLFVEEAKTTKEHVDDRLRQSESLVARLVDEASSLKEELSSVMAKLEISKREKSKMEKTIEEYAAKSSDRRDHENADRQLNEDVNEKVCSLELKLEEMERELHSVKRENSLQEDEMNARLTDRSKVLKDKDIELENLALMYKEAIEKQASRGIEFKKVEVELETLKREKDEFMYENSCKQSKDMEDKVSLLETELDKVNRELKVMKEEKDDMEKRVKEYQSKLSDQSEIEKEKDCRLENLKIEREILARESEIKISSFEKDLNEAKDQIQRLNSEQAFLEEERQKFSSRLTVQSNLLKDKDNEIENLRMAFHKSSEEMNKKVSTLEIERNQMNDQFNDLRQQDAAKEEQINDYSAQLVTKNKLLKVKDGELEDIRHKFVDTKKLADDSNEKALLQQAELNKVKAELEILAREKAHKETHDLEHSSNLSKEMEDKATLLEMELSKVNNELNLVNQQKANQEKQIKEYQEKLSDQCEINKEKDDNFASLKLDYDTLACESEIKILTYEKELSKLEEELSKVNVEFNNLKQQQSVQEEQINDYSAKLDAQTNQLKDRDQELKNVLLMSKENDEKALVYQGELIKLNAEFDVLKQEKDIQEQHANEHLSKIPKEMEEKIVLLEGELSHVNNELVLERQQKSDQERQMNVYYVELSELKKDKDENLNHLREEFDKLARESEINIMSYEKDLNEAHNKINILNMEQTRLKEESLYLTVQLKNKDEEIKSLNALGKPVEMSKKLSTLEVELKKVNDEFNNLKEQEALKEEKIKEYAAKLTAQTNLLRDKDRDFEQVEYKLRNDAEDAKQQIIDLKKRLNEVNEEINYMKQKKIILDEQLKDYSSQLTAQCVVLKDTENQKQVSDNCIEEMSQNIACLGLELSNANTELDFVKRQNVEQDAQIKEYQSQLSVQANLQIEFSNKYQEIKRDYDNLVQESDIRASSYNSELNKLNDEFDILKQEKDQLELIMNERSSELVKEMEVKISCLQVELNKVKEELDFVKQQKADQEEQIENYLSQLATKQEIEKEKDFYSQKASELEKEFDNVAQEKKILECKVSTLTKEKTELESLRAEVERSSENYNMLCKDYREMENKWWDGEIETGELGIQLVESKKRIEGLEEELKKSKETADQYFQKGIRLTSVYQELQAKHEKLVAVLVKKREREKEQGGGESVEKLKQEMMEKGKRLEICLQSLEDAKRENLAKDHAVQKMEKELKSAQKDTSDAVSHMNTQIEIKNQEIKRVKEQHRALQSQVALDGTFVGSMQSSQAPTATAPPPPSPPPELPEPLKAGYKTCCKGGCISMEALYSASRGSGVVNRITFNMASMARDRAEYELEQAKKEAQDLKQNLVEQQNYDKELKAAVLEYKAQKRRQEERARKDKEKIEYLLGKVKEEGGRGDFEIRPIIERHDKSVQYEKLEDYRKQNVVSGPDVGNDDLDVGNDDRDVGSDDLDVRNGEDGDGNAQCRTQ